LFALFFFLISFIFIFSPIGLIALGRLISNSIKGTDRRLFENIESLIYNLVAYKHKIRVQVGSILYEGEVKKIDRNLVIVSVDQQSKEHEIHIRWEAIQAFEVFE